MAYTKIHPIKTTVDKAIDYVTNSQKTDEKLLVSSFACTEQTAYMEFEITRNKFKYTGENLAYHCIQSFKPDEVTPEQAHMIGIQTADELLKGKYEYVISTHVDRGHIHNHIIICGVNFESGLSFGTEHDRKNNPAWKQLRKISDDICLENKLSVISMPEKGYGKCYYEWLQEQRDNSYKGKLKRAVDDCILSAESYDDFLKKMQTEKKYEYKIRGNSLSFRAEEQERFTRCSRKNFGWYYEPEQIKKRIERQIKKRSAKLTENNGFIEVNDNNSVGLNRWAALKNMQEASRALNLLSDYGIGSAEELEEKISEQYDRKFDLVQQLNGYEKTIREQRELLKMLNAYWETKEVHDKFIELKEKSKADSTALRINNFKSEHHRELTTFNSAKEWLRERYTGTSLPNRSVLEMKITEEESKRETLLQEYHDIKKSLKTLENAKEKMEKYFEIEQKEQKKLRENWNKYLIKC